VAPSSEPSEESSSDDDDRDCFLIGGDESGSGYINPDEWLVDGIKSITAGLPDGATTGFVPDNKPRFMDTNPDDPSELTDDSFGSPNTLCSTSGPGLGSGGESIQKTKTHDLL
jgi:hypothetical protein